MSKPDFWYLLGSDYEVTIFRSQEEAEKAKVKQGEDVDDGYFRIFEGWLGKEFNAWIGSHR